jgi:arabinose-5-phosphate isomerase
MTPEQRESAARRALDALRVAVDAGTDRLSGQVADAAAFLAHDGVPLVFTGTGKSGHVALALAGTLRSIGRHAHFLPADELLHGDLGAVRPPAVVVWVSRSGGGATISTLLDVLGARDVPVVAIVGDSDSLLARRATRVIDASVPGEADRAGILPTASTVLALTAGLALAVVMMEDGGMTPEDFLHHHPAGALGARLTTCVREAMTPLAEAPVITEATSVRELVAVMTRYPTGLALVVGKTDELIGVVSDGDLRRALLRFEDVLDHDARDIMTSEPTVCAPDLLLAEALAVIERHAPTPISALPVLEDGRPIGVITIHQLREVIR